MLSATPTETMSTTIPAAATPTSPLPATAPPLTPLPLPATGTPTPSAGSIALDDLKYRLIAQFGTPFYCDPARYPVAHLISDEQVAQSVAALQKNPQEYEAILRHLGLSGMTSLTVQQQRDIFNENVMLNAIMLTPAGEKYEFNLRVGNYGTQGTAISGVIDSSGAVTVAKREPTFLSCPICLAADTLINTPQGQIAVQDVKQGMLVWTADASGRRLAAPVLETVRRPVPPDVWITQVVLEDGRALLVSPNHPTMDGRVIADLQVGDFLDGTRVASAERVIYRDGWTYDILPAGETGAYWANGIWLKSTLAK